MKRPYFKPVDSKASLPKLEHELLDFWEQEKIFERSLQARRGKPKYVFFDGPPFANGLPHYGHILANALKDAVTRYWTMRGYYVPRVNGWDCHGLPVEYEIEKELKLSGRKDIEKMGVAKFNSACRESVFRYTEEWEKLLKRIFRWVDFDHSYATLENEYMESIWWVFKEIWKKKLVYQQLRSMHVCPRCETPLSNFEVTLGYKDVADMSVIWKFRLTKEKNTSFLAWTTTPWSTPGTTGLSVGPDFDYVKVKVGDEFVITAKARLEFVMKGIENYEVVSEMKGEKLIGLEYEPILDDFKKLPEVEGNQNVYHVFGADYVEVTEGTGIVTINGSYGEIDMEAAKKNGLPIIMDVSPNGRFNELLPAYQGIFVKEAEKQLIADMKKAGKIWSNESYVHSYPHCWRCDTPLLNYATKAWFIRVTDVKDKLLKNNKKIHWVPEHIQVGRFGKWLEGARDWNISRNRFWGCPIPVWECTNCGEKECIGSLKELREQSAGGNTFFAVRHGEAEQNLAKVLNSDPRKDFHLTGEGRVQAKKAAESLKKKKIDIIFCSHFPRAAETAEILSETLGVPVTTDDRLREHEMGTFDGKEVSAFVHSFADLQERFYKKVKGGESFEEMEERVIEFVNYLNRKYSGKNIIIVTHGDVIRAIARYFDRLSIEETFKFKPELAAVYEYRAGKLPLRDGKLDLHKPYIDEIELSCKACKAPMKRITEVMDCWFESGAMPYAQLHYPFENKKEFEDNFPANFIAEGLDQTRGWFYTLHVLSTILFNKPAFQNVIVNGILLASDGEKLSKRKKNYPDPNMLFETHGVDSTRMFLYASTAPLAEDVRFSEKHVEEMVKKFTLPLWNTFSFFVTYANIDGWTPEKGSKIKDQKSKNKLDEWILSELHVLIAEVTTAMEAYNLSKATRPLLEFVEKLSNWYIRRSRRRFWKSENDHDKEQAYTTLHAVLTHLSLLIAPFMPALADAMYRNLTGKTSVHLEDWPASDKKLIKAGLNEEVNVVRTIVSLALSLRAKKNIKVRQPLQSISLALPQKISPKLIEMYRDVILEEINVKSLALENESTIAIPVPIINSKKVGPRFGKDAQRIFQLVRSGDFALKPDGSVQLPAKASTKETSFVLHSDEIEMGYRGKEGFDVASESGILVSLNTTLTDELVQEGYAREIIRSLQELRKKAGYDLADRIYVYVKAEKKIRDGVTRFAEMIKRETLALELQEGGEFEWDAEQTIELDGEKITLGVRK